MPNVKVTTTKTEAKVTVNQTQAVISLTESPVEIVTGTSGPQGATGVVTAEAPITYDLANASVGINIGQNLETVADTLKVTDDLTAIDSIAFDTAAGETSAVGKIVWNDTDGTLEFGLKGGNVTLQVGQEQVVRVRNNTGSLLHNGSAVYITSANSGQINVTLASNDTEAASSKTLGILTEDIPNGEQGYCTTQGLVRGLNTSALTEGATIWLGTNGGLTTTRPTAPANSVVIGVCVSQSQGQATNGVIFVRVINGFELEELHDVLISSPADNEVLTYEASSGLWKNKSNPADGVTSITASSPLTGGTITSTGTIGLDQTALSITAGQVGGTAVVRTDNLFTLNGTAIPFGGTASSYITAVASPLTYNGGTAGLDQAALSISPSQVTGTAVITTDPRLSDSRTPTAHAASHASAGSDPVTLAQSQVTNLVSALKSKLSVPLLKRTGLYYVPASTGTLTSISTGFLRATPIYLSESSSFDRVAIDVTTGATNSVVYLGIYDANSDNTPNSLIYDFGSVSASTNGLKEITSSYTLQPGLYWAVLVTTVAGPTLRTINVPVIPVWPYPTSATSLALTLVSGIRSTANTYTSLPATFPTSIADQTNAPMIGLRFA